MIFKGKKYYLKIIKELLTIYKTSKNNLCKIIYIKGNDSIYKGFL